MKSSKDDALIAKLKKEGGVAKHNQKTRAQLAAARKDNSPYSNIGLMK
jgi:hypothetical protein